MDHEGALDFARVNRHAVLATRRRDASPQLSPVVVGVDDGGYLTISSRETAIKTKNLRRDPGCDLAIFGDRFFGPWISVRGRAQVVSLPQAMAQLENYYRALQGEHPNWDEYRQAMVSERRVLLRIEILEIGPRVSG